MSQTERIVVVGAGLAGLRAAERLRELGFNGELVIIGEEALPPYHRPALSKQLLTGAMRPDDLMLPAYREVGARWRLRTQAGFLLPRKRIVRLPGGEEMRYDGLIIATGVEARRPNDVPYDHPRVLMMRTLPDALALERAISSSRGPVAVLGGGFTGCEIAASLRHMGREVTIIGRAPNLLGNVLGPKLGAWLTNLHGNHGVDLALGCSVKHWEPEDDRIGLALSDGSSMTASCVVIAAGTEPSTTWLRGSGLPLDNGVVCESTCHVVGADDVVAAGDVAQWPNIRFDAVPRRIEHWLNAVEMGRAAAESLLAGRAAAVPFTPMPRFWTEQYGVRIMAAGAPKLGTDTITLGTPDAGTGTVVGYVRDGRLMGVVGVDCPSSVLSWTEKVCEQNPVPTGVPRPAPAVQAPVPVPVPAPVSVSVSADPPAAAPRKRTARHSLDARNPRLPTQTSARTRQPAPDSNTRMRPVGPAESYGRLAPVSGRPVDASGRMRPVGPADSNGRLAPVNGRPGPMDSSARIPPAGTNGHVPPLGPVNRRPGPVESNPRMRPVGPADSYGRLAPVNGRPGPMGSSARIPPAGANGRIPIPPVGTNGRTIPAGTNGHSAGTNGRIPPVGTNGHSAGTNGRIAPTEITGFLQPIDIGGRLGPANTDGRSGPAEPNGHSAGTNGRIPPVGANGHSVGTNGRVPPVGNNGHSTGTNGRVPPVGNNGYSAGANGHSVGTNGRIPIPPLGTNGRIPPVGANGHPMGTNGRVPPVGNNGHSTGTNGRVPPVGTNGQSAAANGRIIPPGTNGHSVGTNGRAHPASGNHHSSPPPVDDVEVTGWITRRDW